MVLRRFPLKSKKRASVSLVSDNTISHCSDAVLCNRFRKSIGGVVCVNLQRENKKPKGLNPEGKIENVQDRQKGKSRQKF